MEYVPFCRNKRELAVFEKMLKTLKCSIYEIDSTISSQARQTVQKYALSHSMEMGDALIAATAIAQNELLCTSNIKHFTPVSNIQLEHYNPKE